MLFFSLSFVSSASSKISSMPDLCLNPEVAQYRITLNDYFNIDLSEDITIDYTEPSTLDSLSLPANYYTINLECWNMLYHYLDGDDVLDLETLEDECSFDLLVNFHDTPGLDTSFNVNVSDSCGVVGNPEPVTDPVYISSYWYEPFNNYSDSINFYSTRTRFAQLYSFSGETLYSSVWRGLMPVYAPDNEKLISRVRYVSNDSVVFSSNIFNSSDYSEAFNFTFVYSNPISLTGNYYVTVENVTPVSVTSFSLFGHTLDGGSGSYVYNSSSVWDSKPYGFQHIFNLGFPSGSMSDLNLNQDSYYVFNLSSNYSDYSSVVVYFNDPLTNYSYILPEGYSSIIGDYVDIGNGVYSNGTLSSGNLVIKTYSRPYDFSYTLKLCDGSSNCINDTISVSIGGSLSGVVDLNPFSAYYNLGFTTIKTFSMNSHFQYYENVTLIFPETNFSGVLNSTFPYLYNDINGTNSAKYLVYIPCDISQDLSVVNILGDLNVTMECGDGNAYFRFKPYNSYNQTIYFLAENSVNSSTGETILLIGNTYYNPGELPDSEIVENDTTTRLVLSSFDDLFDSATSLSDSSKHKVVFISFFVFFLSVSILLYSFIKSVGYSLLISLGFSLVLWLYFASRHYVSFAYPIFFSVLYLILLFYKVFKGGSS